MTQENDSEVMMAQENVQKVIKIKVFYMRHTSMSMSRIYPVFLLDGEQIWDAAIKSRISRNKMYTFSQIRRATSRSGGMLRGIYCTLLVIITAYCSMIRNLNL